MDTYRNAIPLTKFHAFDQEEFGIKLGFAMHSYEKKLYLRMQIKDFIGTIEVYIRKSKKVQNALLAFTFEDGKESIEVFNCHGHFIVRPKDDPNQIQVLDKTFDSIEKINLSIAKRVKEGTAMADYLTSIITLCFNIIHTRDIKCLSYESKIFKPFFGARDEFREAKQVSDEWGQMLNEQGQEVDGESRNDFQSQSTEEDFVMSSLSENPERGQKRKLDD